MNLTEDLKDIEAMLVPKTISECASELDTQRTIIEAIDKDVLSHNEKLFALTETVEEHIAQLAELNAVVEMLDDDAERQDEWLQEHEDNIKQLGDELLKVSEATAQKIGDTIASVNKNTIAITEMIEDLNDDIDAMGIELIIHKVLIAVFGVLILWLMFKV